MRAAGSRDAPALERLIVPIFDATIAPTLEEKGREIFRAFVSSEALAGRLAAGNPAVLIEEVQGDGTPIAYAERDGGHIRLMFVALDRQGQGLSRRLLAGLLDGFDGDAVTLRSSDFARPRYEALGFTATGPRAIVNGIVHTPMRKLLTRDG